MKHILIAFLFVSPLAFAQSKGDTSVLMRWQGPEYHGVLICPGWIMKGLKELSFNDGSPTREVLLIDEITKADGMLKLTMRAERTRKEPQQREMFIQQGAGCAYTSAKKDK